MVNIETLKLELETGCPYFKCKIEHPVIHFNEETNTMRLDVRYLMLRDGICTRQEGEEPRLGCVYCMARNKWEAGNFSEADSEIFNVFAWNCYNAICKSFAKKGGMDGE